MLQVELSEEAQLRELYRNASMGIRDGMQQLDKSGQQQEIPTGYTPPPN